MKKLKKPVKNTIELVRPQELYLESNETMFEMVIDEISKLQELCLSIETKT